MKQQGGLILPFKKETENEIVFWDYLEYSTINYVTKGAMGIMFHTTPGPLFESLSNDERYFKVSPDKSFGTPVENLLIKIVIITDTNNIEFDLSEDFSKTFLIESVTKEEFYNEINIQAEIYMKTIQYLQPICPGIVYSTIMNVNDPKYDIFLNSISDVKYKNIMAMVRRYDQPSFPVKIGIIGMEFMSNSTTLQTSISDTKYFYDASSRVSLVKELKNVCRFLLLDLALKTGYNHGDFHLSNFMIDDDCDIYFENISIRPILIDFGRTFKISPLILSKIKECVSNKKYTEALSYLCDYRSSNKYPIEDPEYAASYYGWVCGDYNINNAGYLDELTNDLLQSKNDYIDRYNTDVIAEEATGLSPPQLKPRVTIDEIRSTILTNAVALEDVINDDIQNLFDEREAALTMITKYMDKLHSKDPNRYPLLPLSNAIKNKLYNGMIGGLKKQKKSRKNNRRKRKTRKLIK